MKGYNFSSFGGKIAYKLNLILIFIMLTREEILVIYEAGPEAVIPLIQRLETIIEKQAIQIAELEERVKFLESRLNQNSRNESIKYPVQYGPNILASAIYCKNYQFIPYERISEFFDDVMGIKICPATIIRAERDE